MPVEVEIPDHGVAEFPDEMSPEDIQGVIQKQFYGSETNVPRGNTLARAQELGASPYSDSMTVINPDVAEMTRGNEPITPIPPISQQEGAVKQIAAGAVNALSGGINALQTPTNIQLAPVAAVPGLGRVIGAIFGVDMARHIPEQIESAIEAPTLQGKVEGFGTAGLTGVLAGLGLRHATKGLPGDVRALRGGLQEKLAPVLGEESAPVTEPAIAEPTLPVEAPKPEVPPVTPDETISSPERAGGTRPAETAGPVLGESAGEVLPIVEPEPVTEPVRPTANEATPTVEPETVTEPISPAPAEGRQAQAEPVDTGAAEITTSTKNAVTAAEREARGLPEAEQAARRDFGTVWDEAAETAKADPTAPQRLVESLKENPRALTDQENALLLRRQIEVQGEHDAAVKAVNESTDPVVKADAQARLDKVREDLQTVYDAAKIAGTETGRGLNARKMLANQDYSLAQMEATTRAVVNNGKALSPAQLTEVKALHERIRVAETKLSAYEAKEAFEIALKEAKREAKQTGFKAQDFLDRQAQRARERIAERRTRLHSDPLGVQQIAHLADEAIIGASHIARGVTKFADWSAQMISEFGDRIKPHLQALFAKAKELHNQATSRVPLTAEERTARGLAGDKKAIQTRITKLEEKTAKGDFTKPEKNPRMDEEKAALLFEYQKAREAYNKKLFQAKLDQQSVPRKIFRTGGEVVNTARAIQTSFDLSAVLRQGGLIALAHPIRAVKNFPDMIRAFGSERAQHRINAEIMARPNAPLYKRAKLFLVDEGAVSLSKMEEVYMSRWAEKLPGVGASQRAYTTFLNKLRADSFDAMAESLGRNGKVTLDESRAIANFVNIATGRGDVSLFPQAAVSLNTVFFAPRLVLSRFQFLAGQPLYRGSMRTRGLIAKEYARFLAGAATIYALGMAAGATVETDPTSPDFSKLKFGNTRLDMLAGLQQVSVFSARESEAVKRFIKGEQKNPKYGSGGEVLGRFLRTKLAPAPGAAVNVISGKSVTGQQVTPRSVAADLVTPMSIGDIYRAMEEQGVPKGSALATLSLFGAGVQTYDEKKKAAKKP